MGTYAPQCFSTPFFIINHISILGASYKIPGAGERRKERKGKERKGKERKGKEGVGEMFLYHRAPGEGRKRKKKNK